MAEINVFGPIVDDETAAIYNFFDVACVSPQSVSDQLNEVEPDEDITVNIASDGGIAESAQKMYTDISLAAQTHQVTCQITGMAASAATIVAMACPVINISPSGMMMIHKASCDFGNINADDMAQYMNQLDETDKSIVGLYQKRTGLDENTLLKMMSDTTFMNAQTCVQKGFADAIMDLSSTNKKTAMVTNSLGGFANDKTISRMAEIMKRVQPNDPPEPKNQKLNRVESLKRTFGVF
ncbi:Clp protease ClpP [Fructilactobacillus cliffordii]|uniref:head maturation protease, ClpP-related n=1 Tax=Fructilactobacillus cliffordii TaxID=2940299 RepID=UPI00209220EF|nr:head maturation protease, ClpP-related [Fructilactobacillus cliffordii]USS86488.1 Clp protease ClpP [Fructilactobacillus cliffordii]